MRKASGFTMIELMVVVAALAVVLAWGIPWFERLAEKMRLMRATEPVYERLVWAHSEAIKRFRPIVVSFSAAGTETWSLGVTDKASCTATVTSPSDSTACTLDYDNNPATTDPFLVRTDSVDLPKVVMAAPVFTAGAAYTAFEAVRGAADPNGQVVLTTPHFATTVQVAASGSIRICSPAGASKVAWYPDC
jgi:type IV fimbrial biogenesis protein FimT